MNHILEQWGHTSDVDIFQRYLWRIMYREWISFIGEMPSPSLDIGAARSKGHSTISLDPFPRGFVDIKALGENLPLRDDIFSSIIMESVLKHVLSPIRVLMEARRVVKNGGFLFISSPVNRVDHHRHSFTAEQLCMLVESHGFRIIRKRGIGIKYRRIDGALWRRIPRIYVKLRIPSDFSTVLYIIAQAI